ncbi:TPA: hypothetical protein ACF3P8_002614 [Serratia marcescens]
MTLTTEQLNSSNEKMCGGDSVETIEKNPKSWAAWKREAERLQAIIDDAANREARPVEDDGIFRPGDAVGVFNVGCETCPDHLVAWTVKGKSLPVGNYWLYTAPPAPAVVKLPTTRLWAGVVECYSKDDVISAMNTAGVEISND